MTDMPWLDWYQSLAKPSWTPAPGTIGLIWQVLDWQALVGSLFVGTGPEFTARAHSLARVPFGFPARDFEQIQTSVGERLVDRSRSNICRRGQTGAGL